MAAKPTVMAVNGSPHVGFGNTSQMLAMLREGLEAEAFALEEICLSQHHLEPCRGCALCLEKGACWIRDDYKNLVQRVLGADAVILASPVYFLNVTGQMKIFLDRSLGYGHRPRGAWKPGLAVSVSAGCGETWVADYLGRVLKVYGAFPVGQFTAIAVGPGEFWGLEAVAARARDLAQDLARAVREGRRYPATDQDLHFWHFMGHLIREHQDFMKADHDHWQKLGLYQSFETYVGQSRSPHRGSPEMREAWLKALMATAREPARPPTPPAAASAPAGGATLRELLQSLPALLNADAAAGLSATFQFEVSGEENFTAHLTIQDGQATYHDGPADRPEVVIQTPAAVWLALARGELNGSWAYLTGKFRARGEVSLLMKFKSLFSG